MVAKAIIHGFMAGEVSPAMALRSEVLGMKYGAKEITNWNSTLQGPVETRYSLAQGVNQLALTVYPGQAYGYVSKLNSSGNLEYYFVELTTTTIYISVYDSFTGTWVSETTISKSVPVSAFSGVINCLQPPGKEELWIFFEKNQVPLKVYYSTTWQVADISWIWMPTDWGYVSGSDTYYTKAVCFFANRLWQASASIYSHKFWGSQTDKFTDFSLGASLPSEAIEHTLPNPGIIQWLAASKNLVIGTDAAEYIVTAQEGVIIPGDIQVDQQSTHGSIHHKIAQSSGTIFFITKNGKGVRSMSFEWTKKAWTSKDMMFASEHLVQDYALSQIVYHEYGDMLLALREDGKILRGIYNAEDESIGWSTWGHSLFPSDTNTPEFKALGVGPVAIGNASLVGYIQYTAVSATEYMQTLSYLESANLDNSTVYETTGVKSRDVLLDFVHVEKNATAFSSLTSIGLTNRTGLTAIIDGVIYTDQSLSGSTYTMPVSGNLCLIGVPVTGQVKVETLSRLIATGEFTQVHKKRWARVFAHIVDSYAPTIEGKVSTISKDTRDIQLSTLGWDRVKTLTLTHVSPYRSVVAGIFGNLGEDSV